MQQKLSIILTVTFILLGCSGQRQAQVESLQSYLADHCLAPEDYLVSCFENHDIVFVGEYHRIKHDVQLIHHMIPRLYERGIYDLGIEFANYEDQPLIDRLIKSDIYDDSLACLIQFRQWPFWGFREYVDIYRIAWELNHALPAESPKFRVVGLNARSDWSHIWTQEDRDNPNVMKDVWKDGDSDAHMARIIMKEFIEPGRKALIYSGINHGYTRYLQPIYDTEKDSLIRFNDKRMGNIIYKEIGDRCMTIFLHSPWPGIEGYDESVRPVDGLIGEAFAQGDNGHAPCGFDIAGSPFADLSGESSFWSHGYPDFTLGEYCDGYIYHRPLSEYEGCEVIEDFINESNRLDAIAQIANPRVKDSSRTVHSLMQSLYSDTDFSRRFATFR